VKEQAHLSPFVEPADYTPYFLFCILDPMAKKKGKQYPIAHWSFSSLLSYLRNPLAWYKRYVLRIYDTPRSPASVIGVAGHIALEHFYQGLGKPEAIEHGLVYLRNIPDFEINFGVAKTRTERKKKRAHMEKDYLQAIGFYLARAPRHRVVGVEVKGVAKVSGLPLPVKSVADLVVESKGNPGCLDVVDHKFVESFSKSKAAKPLFALQAMFNYFVVLALYKKPLKRFIIIECKKSKNKDGRSQLRRYVINYEECRETFTLFERLIQDASAEIRTKKKYLPNPSDMFDGEDSYELYRLQLAD
jgi:DNA segregation ATPase FtsK/SpoIIIE, S-DNA-T family